MSSELGERLKGILFILTEHICEHLPSGRDVKTISLLSNELYVRPVDPCPLPANTIRMD
jgi:hypothetical protein